jgi:hypothetical protein
MIGPAALVFGKQIMADVTQADNQNRLQKQVGYKGGRITNSSFLRKQESRLYLRLLDSRVRGNDEIPTFAYD